MTDIEIAQSAKLQPIEKIAEKLGLSDLEFYGKYKAKIPAVANVSKSASLILVTAITPTKFGEGKTTTSIGLADAISKLGKKICLCLREPSMGPVFGLKGGACGGGYAQVVPMDEINLHFTGDFHALTSAHNLTAACLDNHLFQGNALNFREVIFNRCLDMNDRALRRVVIGLGSFVRESSFDITVASEFMAALCLADNLADLKQRLGKIILGYDTSGKRLTIADLNIVGSLAVLLKDAVKPNLVQTLEGTPTLIHGGPFANIAHGANSLIATKTALSLADYVVTEAGFGSDLGAEKFFNIVCRAGKIQPSAVVIVATCRALKVNGLENLQKHIENIQSFGAPVVVALNHFPDDSEQDISAIKNLCEKMSANFALSDVFGKGGEGGLDLAQKVIDACKDYKLRYTYELNQPVKSKIEAIAKKIYGAAEVNYTPKAEKQLARFADFANLPVCMAKTPLSLSDNPALSGRPKDFAVTVRDLKVSAGAGFIVALLGDILTMPGLPKVPVAEKIDIDDDGKIVGLF